MAILAITYEFGSGGEEIGHAIEKQLGYEYVALRRILNEAKQLGDKWERFGTDYAVGVPTIWERYDWSFMGFMALVQSIILDHVQKDNVVVMTRTNLYLLSGIPHVLKVRIVAPLEARIKRIMLKEDTSWEAARLLIKQADHEVASTAKRLYGKKVDEPDAYDIQMDTSSAQGLDQCVGIVKGLLEKKNLLKTAEAEKMVELKALAARAKAAILTNSAFLIPTLEVEVRDEGIAVRGVARNVREHKAIEQEINKICGNTPVNIDIHYRGVI